MSRSFSEVVKMILDNSNIQIFYLVKVEFPGETLMHTTLPYAVTIPPLGTFQSNNTLKSVEAPRLTSVVDRVSYKVVYADPDFEFKSRFEIGATGSLVTIYIGFFNTLDSVVLGTDPGNPILDSSTTLVAYKGVIDSHGYNIGDDGDESLATFECSSPMADLNQKTFFVTTDAEQRKRNPNDTSLANVHVAPVSQTLKWGKL